MELVILVIHIILAFAIIGVVLLQPPESSSLGGLGGSNMMASSGRGQSNLLTRMTAIFATAFIITSLILAYLAGHKGTPSSILDEAETSSTTTQAEPAKVNTPDPKPVTEKPAKQAPSVPLSE